MRSTHCTCRVLLTLPRRTRQLRRNIRRLQRRALVAVPDRCGSSVPQFPVLLRGKGRVGELRQRNEPLQHVQNDDLVPLERAHFSAERCAWRPSALPRALWRECLHDSLQDNRGASGPPLCEDLRNAEQEEGQAAGKHKREDVRLTAPPRSCV